VFCGGVRVGWEHVGAVGGCGKGYWRCSKEQQEGYPNRVIGKTNDCNAKREKRKPSQLRIFIRGNKFVTNYHIFVMYHHRTDSWPTRRATLGAAASVETASNEEGGGWIVGPAYVGSDRIGLKDKLR
jgi:hypothetical protein